MEIIKKVLAFLREMDFIWSLPLALVTFVTFPIIGQQIYGESFSFYSPEFIHAIIYAGLVNVAFNSMAQIGIYINFPELYKFYLGEGFKELPTIQKCIIFLFVYLFFFISLLLTWLVLV